MTEKQLIQKLNNLREIQPNSDWLKANRDSLYSQISNSGAKELSSWSSFVINFSSLAKTVSMPAVALASFLVFILLSSIFSHQLLMNAKPSDSLYIARVISEKAKLNTIFNNENREKMAAQFATSHAQDIITVLSDPSVIRDEAEVAKLSENFKAEINTAKQSISKLNNKPAITPSVIATAISDEVFSANLGKDEAGLSLSVASTSSSSEQILEQAASLFEKKDYLNAGKVLELIK